ncbi:CBS domain-containing protein [Paraburkholderia sp. RP-4-7]|uniref:CBS domain-containing protein n=1 Tax=Paraburkholderia polaris TaxID=2728848 RepID=A0A848IT76_9BURK|nr:CBS domain-containing protein [Paraburkholderia polaris]
MITDRDIAMRGLADDWRVDQVTVWEVMSAQIIPCFEDDSVE